MPPTLLPSTEASTRTDAPTPAKPPRRPVATPAKVLATLGVLLVAVALFVVSSLAVFTDTDTITANQFTTGSVILDLSTTSNLVEFTSPAMAPGDEVTAPLTVTNSGTLDLRYAMTSTTTENTLAGALVLTIREDVTTCDNTNWDLTGTQVYTGPLGNTVPLNILGNPAQGAQAGDRTLTEAGPTDNEVLCFNVTLPLSETTGAGLTTTATFTFESEQIANN